MVRASGSYPLGPGFKSLHRHHPSSSPRSGSAGGFGPGWQPLDARNRSHNEHRERFKGILNRIAGKIPGIDRIDTEQSPDGRLLLRFNDKGFDDPFYAQQMSDGTLKVFAYLVLLEDPEPPSFICIEEPENGLYHKLLEILAEELRAHATGRRKAPQIFVTTYQPYFVNALQPDETWILEKQADGFASISRASDDKVVSAMVKEGLPLGGLWCSDYLDFAGA